MPFAINIFFDPATEHAIQAIWQELAEADVASYMHQSNNRPHIKLAIYDTLNIATAEQRLRSFAEEMSAMPVSFKSFGIFPKPKPTVFLGPVVTNQLLELQQRVDQLLRDLGTTPPFEFFLPSHYVPHCILALEIESEQLSRALQIAMHLPLPTDGQISEIGIIEFRPVQLRCVFPLRQTLES